MGGRGMEGEQREGGTRAGGEGMKEDRGKDNGES